jgi:ribonuclease HI
MKKKRYMNKKSKMIRVYTDGSCRNKSGGWGFISIDIDCEFHISGGERNTTNNRMELQAVIEAVKFHKCNKQILIVTDSEWTMKGCQGINKRNKNLDLFEIYDRVSRHKIIRWEKVKAHSGDKYNDIVDELAKSEMREIDK